MSNKVKDNREEQRIEAAKGKKSKFPYIPIGFSKDWQAGYAYGYSEATKEAERCKPLVEALEIALKNIKPGTGTISGLSTHRIIEKALQDYNKK